jgi:phosphohistidine swiveling domain-containing protein
MSLGLETAQLIRSEPARLILGLSETGAGDAALVGRKAHRLAMLMHGGFDVPRGFCITTEAFRRCETSRQGEIALPLYLREAIVSAWRLSGMRLVAVRSSASEEDGDSASWAGVFPTVLPVASEEALIAAVEACFKALHSPEAELYRRSHVKRHQPPAMAVLVQSVVEANAAGMAFTANPATGSTDEIVVNAVTGLGEPLASGRLSGDVFVLSRSGRLNSASISPKPFALTLAGEVALGPEEAAWPALTEAEANAVARLALRVEAISGCPQDIEFAIARERIYLLQARPITGPGEAAPVSAAEVERYLGFERARLKARVETLREEGQLKGATAIFSSGNVGELLPSPTPMSAGLFRSIFAGKGGAIAAGRRMLGYRIGEAAIEALYEPVCGQLYFNVEIDAGTFDIGLPIDADAILASITEGPSRANYPEFGLYCQALGRDDAVERYGAVEGPHRHATVWRFHAAMVRHAGAFRRRYGQEIEPQLRRSLEPVAPGELSGPDCGLLAAFQRRQEHLRGVGCVWFVVAARLAFYFADMVRCRLEHHLGDSSLAARLFQGLEGSLVTGQALDLENLSLGRIEHGEFVRRYGHTSSNELEISLPRLEETPEAISRRLLDLALSGRRPAAEFREQQRRRRAVERKAGRLLLDAGAGTAGVRALFADLRLAQAFLPLRETVKHYYTGQYRALRQILLEINRRLGWADGDIFYLEPSEIPRCFDAPEELAVTVRRRRHERKIALLLAARRRIPAVIFSERLEAIGAQPEGLRSTHLRGVPVAPGSAAGTVRLLDGADGEAWCTKELHGGEIIVARSANLGLSPLLRMAAGLVVEAGGVLAHAACQARESGIPAVVLPSATRTLREGMRVSIDGATGAIEVLDDLGAAP